MFSEVHTFQYVLSLNVYKAQLKYWILNICLRNDKGALTNMGLQLCTNIATTLERGGFTSFCESLKKKNLNIIYFS